MHIKVNKKIVSLLLIMITALGYIGLLSGCKYKTEINATETNNTEINDTEINDTEINDTEINDTESKDIKQVDESVLYYGEWCIQQVQTYGIGTYGEEDVNKILGKTLLYSEKKASMFSDHVESVGKEEQNPSYDEITYTESEFVEFYDIPTDLLGISNDKITEISVRNDKGHIATLLLKDENTLISFAGGTFFELIRIVK